MFEYLISTNRQLYIPERFTTVDITTGSSVFPTSLFYQLIHHVKYYGATLRLIGSIRGQQQQKMGNNYPYD